MITKTNYWGKIFLVIGLLLVAVNGIWLDPRVSRHFISTEDAGDQDLTSINEAYLKIRSRLKIFREYLGDLSLLQQKIHGDPLAENKHLKGLPFPMSQLGPRFFPKFSMKLELRQAKKELVNIERKIEHLEVLCASIERDIFSTGSEDKTKPLPSDLRQANLSERIKFLRQQLSIDKTNLKALTAALQRMGQSYARGV